MEGRGTVRLTRLGRAVAVAAGWADRARSVCWVESLHYTALLFSVRPAGPTQGRAPAKVL